MLKTLKQKVSEKNTQEVLDVTKNKKYFYFTPQSN